MTNRPVKPDFIVDQFGHVQDVRQQKSSPQPASAPSPNRISNRVIFRSSQKSGSHLLLIPIPIGLIITILVYLINGTDIRANNYFNNGNSNYDIGLYALAITEFDKAIEAKPDFGQAYNNRGLAYFATRDYDKALADASKTIELLPNSPSGYNNRGNAFMEKGDSDKAIADYDKALQLNSRFAKAYYNRGLAYSSKGDYDKAIADYGQAIQFTFETPPTMLRKAPTIEGYKTLKRMTDRLDELRDDANLPLVYQNRGTAYLAENEFDLAIADFTKAIQLQPDMALAHYGRGAAYYLIGDYDKAITNLKKVLELNNDPTAQQAAEALLNDLGVK